PVNGLRTVCDRDRIAQVLANLLSNAVRYAPNGAIVVRLERQGAEAIIRISDEGPGIPQRQPEAMVAPYVRLVTGNPAQKGSELGLSISRSIVEAHGGRIRADNRPGKGAVFSVVLPLSPVAAAMPR